MLKRAVFPVLLVALAATLLAAAAAGGETKKKPKPAFPATIQLPNGFQPEGIDIEGNRFYVGSIPTGAVYKGSLVTGKGDVLVPAKAGRAAIGVDVDRGRIFVAGGPTGRAFVYDARTGADLAEYVLTTAADKFINDVVVTHRAAWFTDSFNQVLYRLPLDPRGRLPAPTAVQTVPLTGDITFVAGFNVNGIDATPSGKTLVIVQSNTGLLFTVNAATGVARRIDLGGTLLRNGDGILLHGKRLYVVQNFDNQIAVVRLAANRRSGVVVRRITDPRFHVPTTIDRFGPFLYAVNARFPPPPQTPDTTYTVVRVRG